MIGQEFFPVSEMRCVHGMRAKKQALQATTNERNNMTPGS